MSIIQVSFNCNTVECHTSLRSNFESLKGRLKAIDPSLVDEPRYNQNRSIVINIICEIVLYIFYGLKNFYYRNEIRSLNAQLKIVRDSLDASTLEKKPQPETQAMEGPMRGGGQPIPRAVQNGVYDIEDSQREEMESGFSFTTSGLIESFERCWNQESMLYENLPYDKSEIIRNLKIHNQRFAFSFDEEKYFGYIDLKTVPTGTKLFVRADIHGCLKNLIDNIKALKDLNLLDENYNCKEGVVLIFLGDYTDRGFNSVQVFVFLMTMRIKNPGRVFLLRGNHESIWWNFSFIKSGYCLDGNYREFFKNERGEFEDDEAIGSIKEFHKTLPLAVYVRGEREKGQRKECVLFTHGAFELYVDPVEMFNRPNNARMFVPRYRKKPPLSDRILDLVNLKLQTNASFSLKKKVLSARKLFEFWELDKRFNSEDQKEDPATAYNWGDLSEEGISSLGSLQTRTWRLSAKFIKSYFCATGNHNCKTTRMIRGHQHSYKEFKVITNGSKKGQSKEEIIVTTLPRSKVGSLDEGFIGNEITYILTVAPKVKDWKKLAMNYDIVSSKTEFSEEFSIDTPYSC